MLVVGVTAKGLYILYQKNYSEPLKNNWKVVATKVIIAYLAFTSYVCNYIL